MSLTFSEPVPDITALQLTVNDGAGPLPGTLSTMDSGTTWRWSAVRTLPLGATLEVRLAPSIQAASGAVPDRELAATFTIEQPTPIAYELGAATTSSAQAWNWPVADPAVVTTDQVLSARGAGAVASLPQSGTWIAAARDDLGGWMAAIESNRRVVALSAQPGGPIAMTDLAPITGALGDASLAVNRRGDAVLYTYRPGNPTPEESLFHFDSRSGAWQPVALTPTSLVTVRRLDIDAAGNAWIAFIDGASGRLLAQRFDASSGASENLAITERVPGRYWVATAENGHCQVLWEEPVAGTNEWVRRRRVFRDGALEAAQDIAQGTRLEARAFAAPPSGSAVSVLEGQDGWYLERHELDGTASRSDRILTELPERYDLCAATRGVAWFVWVGTLDGQRGIYGTRSDAGRAAQAPVLLTATDRPIESLEADIEDGGQFVVAFIETVNGSRILRSIVAE